MLKNAIFFALINSVLMKINYRPIFYFAVCFVVGLLLAKYFVKPSIIHIVFAILFLASILYFCIKKRYFKRLVILSLAFFIGIFYFISGALVFMKDDIDMAFISGRIKSGSHYSTYGSYILDDVKINNKDTNFCISALVYGDEIEIGKVITFSSSLESVDLFGDDEYATYYYKQNAPYRCYISYDDISIGDGYTKLGETIVESFYNYLTSVCSEDMAGFITCVIFGDKTHVSPGIESAYLDSGMSHLLAVSGMHIAILVSIFSFILNKLKTKKWLKFLIIVLPLAFFTYLCDFAPSITRALVMSLVFSFGEVVGKKYDSLNSLGICALIILFIKPIYIFDYGFLLSFLCVFCIFTLTKPFTKAFKRLGFKKFSSLLGLTVSVQLGLIPVLMTISSSFNVLTFIVNLICVPIFEFAFVLTLIIVPLCVLFPFLSFLFSFIQFIYFAVSQLAEIVSTQSWAYIPLVNLKDIFAICSYVSIFCLSDYVLANKKVKAIVSVSVFALGITLGGILAAI